MSSYLHPKYVTLCVNFVSENKKKKVEEFCWESKSVLYYLPDLVSLSLLFSDFKINTCKSIYSFWVNLSKHTFHEFFIEMESRLVVARVQGEGAEGSNR